MVRYMSEKIKSFLQGMGSVLEIAPKADNVRVNIPASSRRNPADDWALVAWDIRRAMDKADSEFSAHHGAAKQEK